MYPRIITLPGGLPVNSYGTCLFIGFVLGLLLARRRARRLKADPAVILDVALLAVVFGLAGARLLYVVHYWHQFADRPHLVRAILNIGSGGLEFLGGFVCATLAILTYFWIAKRAARRDVRRKPVSIRLYLDIIAPSVMVGLAATRAGCFLNGCCFGQICEMDHQDAGPLWAPRFPFGSPVFMRQWEERSATAPAELIRTSRTKFLPRLVERSAFFPRTSDKKLQQSVGRTLPSRRESSRETSAAEFRAIATATRAHPVHPTQLYASINALLLSFVLSGLLYRRRRHGLVVVMLFLLYPISRFLLESIRADNPHDVAGLTISQFMSLLIIAVGIVCLIVLYKVLPERSPALNAARGYGTTALTTGPRLRKNKKRRRR